jgi:outer membrane lipoprotein-sorting protein
MKQVNLSRRTRWAVPAGAVVVVGGVLAGSMITVASASPSLPARTPAQLLASLAGKTAPAMTGTIVETSALGLPSLPGTDNPTSLSSLLTGSHTIRIWYSDPTHFRVAVPQNMSESDLIRNGSSAWLWESTSNTVTHLAIPAGTAGVRHAKNITRKASDAPPMTPQQAANEIVARVGATTTVSSDTNVTVAGQAAYQLVLAPKSPSSLVGQIRIAIDGADDVPLRVQVFAKDAASPAAQVGFTSISFVEPAAANFAFSPPAGAKVEQQSLSGSGSGKKPAGGSLAGSAYTVGKSWLAVADLPQSVLSSVTGNKATGSAGSGLSGDTGPIISALLRSATPVSGSWGSGRLVQTSLLSVLITNDGRVLVGAVTPSVLYAAAGQPAPSHTSASSSSPVTK